MDTKENQSEYKSFYDDRRNDVLPQGYTFMSPEQHYNYTEIKEFIDKYDLRNKKCLEIGSSSGFFQDLVEDYYGTDIADSLAKYYHKPYRVAYGHKYPFEDKMFDAIWSVGVFEHIPHLQQALLEIKRLLKPGGFLFFAPAWQCRSWAAEGYAVRPYSDFGLSGKFKKITIPVRNSVLWRGMFLFPKRIWRLFRFLLGHKYLEIKYKKLNPNYNVFWTSDSDACNNIDPHDAILWFKSHNFDCLSPPSNIKALLFRTGTLIFRFRNL